MSKSLVFQGKGNLTFCHSAAKLCAFAENCNCQRIPANNLVLDHRQVGALLQMARRLHDHTVQFGLFPL